jgi:indole-3-glycerol phosphate synthase
VLRKDFIIDPLQIRHSASINADAVLLIAALLSQNQLQELYQATVEFNCDALVEIHSLQELEGVLKLPLKILGINNRNLTTLAVDTKTVSTIMPHVPAHIAVIAESGIKSGADARAFRACGVRGLLVGEALVRTQDPGKLIKELRCADQD